MLKYFLFILLGFIGFLFLIRLFWVQILHFIMRKVSGKIMDDFARQNNAHQNAYSEFEKQIFVSKDLEIKIPRKETEPAGKFSKKVIEDIDFEELR